MRTKSYLMFLASIVWSAAWWHTWQPWAQFLNAGMCAYWLVDGICHAVKDARPIHIHVTKEDRNG